MKKLKKLKLKEFHEMSDFEMKGVRGGYSGEFGKKCSQGTSDYQCFGSCEQELTYNGTTYLFVGSCHYSGISNICACVVD
jgi:natural product precursor